MADHNDLGKKGEEIAVQHLIDQGYDILFRNWRHGRDEIDIIAQLPNEMVFVEVKTRATDAFGDPEASVTKSKQGRIVNAAHEFLIENDIDLEARFDVISILVNSQQLDVEHIEDAFYPLA